MTIMTNFSERAIGQRPLRNLRPLRDSMEVNEREIEPFDFRYKGRDYDVLAKLYGEDEKKPQYALLKLKFFDSRNEQRTLEVPANVGGLEVSAKELRQFFHIEYGENLHDILLQFAGYLGGYVPAQVTPQIRKEKRGLVLRELIRTDTDGTYCFAVRRDPVKADGTRTHRTVHNATKAQHLCFDIYLEFRDDRTISFCFSIDPAKQKSLGEIVANFKEQGSRERSR